MHQDTSMEDAPVSDGGGVLVVIPCLNEEATIAGVVAAALRERNRLPILVVVADGGSSDRTRELVAELATRCPDIKLMDNPQRLQSAGVNQAAALFGQDMRWLVRMDAHAEYPDHFISSLICAAQQSGADSVVVPMRAAGAGGIQLGAATAQNSVLGTGGAAHRVNGGDGFVDHGHHALFRMAQFRALGGYDAAVSHNEDAEYDVRLARAGGRIWMCRAATISYFPRTSLPALYRQYRNHGYGRANTILRHRIVPKVRQLIPAAIAPALGLLVLAPWLPVAAIPALGWAAICLAYGAMLGLRTGRLGAVAAGPAAMVMHTGWSIGFWQRLLRLPGRRSFRLARS